MTLDQLKHFIRVQIEDTNSDQYQLDDADLYRYIKEAEREAAERAGIFKIDRNIALVADKATYTLCEVIDLTWVKVSGESFPLAKTTKRELDFELGPWDAQPSSTPKYYFRVDDQITLYPTPDAAGTLLLDGTRYADYDLETPEALHESLAYWPMYRFYSIPDIDTHDSARAQFFEDKFSQVFGKKKNHQFIQSWRNDSAYSSMAQSPFNVGSSTSRSLF
jgi:hypothetical protein